jgi:outer membrane lipase/esterase
MIGPQPWGGTIMTTKTARARRILLAAAAALLPACPALAQQMEPTFDEVVSFGDSFSDIGNLSNAFNPGVFNSHTTNPGNTTVENVAEHYGVDQLPSVIVGGRNYAVSGARVVGAVNPGPGVTPATAAQIPNYFSDISAISPRTLFTFIAGGNDVTALAVRVRSGAITPEQAITEAQAVAAAAVQQIDALQQAGARTIIVGRVSMSPDPVADPILDAYNQRLNEGMAGRTGIAPVNTPAIFGGILSDPARFGLTNVTDPACTVPNALNCTAATLVAPNADLTYFLSDATHPSTAAHRMVADVILAQLAAPQQVSLLAETPLALTASHRGAADAALAEAAEGRRAFASLSLISGAFDRTYDTTDADNLGFSLVAGLRLDPAPQLRAGIAVSLGRSVLEFDGGGEFDTNAVILSAFGRRELGQGGYVQADAYLGYLAYSAIERTFDVGVGRHTEEGATTGSAAGVSIGGGWWFEGSVRHGPFAQANLQRIDVDGYREGAHPGTAMTFADQTRDSLIGEIGWQVQGVIARPEGDAVPYASVSYAQDFEADPRLVTAGLRTLNGTFSMPAIPVSEDWVSVRAGVGFVLWGDLAGNLSYQGRFGGAFGGQHQVGLSVVKPL